MRHQVVFVFDQTFSRKTKKKRKLYLRYKKRTYPVRTALRFSREPISASMRATCNLCRVELISVTTATGQIGCNADLPRESPSLCSGTHNRKQYVSNCATRSSPFFPRPPLTSIAFLNSRARSQSNTDTAADIVQFSAFYCILSAAADIFNPVAARIFIVLRKIFGLEKYANKIQLSR